MRTALKFLFGLAVVAALAGCGKKEASIPVYPALSDQCLGASDMNRIIAALDGGYPEAGPWEVPLFEALICGRDPDCLEPLLATQVDAGYQCVDNCYAMQTWGSGLSPECRWCYIVEGLFCAGTYCLTECLGTDYATCDTCFSEQCRPGLTRCVGF